MTKDRSHQIESDLQAAQYLMKRLQEDEKGFLSVAQFLRDMTGINLILNPKNVSLMASRLTRIMRKYDLSSYDQYLKFVKANGAVELHNFVSAFTTNTTQFFREADHFTHLKAVLPQIIKDKTDRGESELRVWCAAASHGQEPYTMLICILEALPNLSQWNLRFLATDLDRECLAAAAEGVYTEEEIESLPNSYRSKYFEVKKHNNRKYYRVLEKYRDLIRFAEFNLMTTPYPFIYKFDIVFCRNVLIYFERKTAEQTVSKIFSCLNPGGILYLGHSESGLIVADNCTSVAPAVYKNSSSRKLRGAG
jgi:chemotaxis protein methyltransferase CheR